MSLLPATACRLALLVLSAAACFVPSARADDQAAFSEMIRHAVTEYESGNWGEAHALFARAHELKPSARTWRGLGLASFELRHYLDAIRELQAALEDFRKPLSQAQHVEVENVLARAQQFIAIYSVRLEPPSAALQVDNQPAQILDGWLSLDPGEHLLVARAAGYQEYRASLRPDAGTRAELPVALVAETDAPAASAQSATPEMQRPAPPARAPTPTATAKNGRRGLLWTGGVGLALGVAFDIWAWRIYAARVGRSEDVVNALPISYEPLRQEWVELRAPLLGFGITGGALTSLGTSLLVLGAPDERLPWWLAGVGAGLGAGLAAWGMADVVRGACASPDGRVCASDGERRERGTLVLLTSAPLFMLPITKLFRGASRVAVDRAHLQIDTTGRGLALRGRW